MNELVALVAQKTGLSPEMSKTAVETVIGFIKKQLPEPLAAQVDAALAGGNNDMAANVIKGLGGMFGGK